MQNFLEIWPAIKKVCPPLLYILLQIKHTILKFHIAKLGNLFLNDMVVASLENILKIEDSWFKSDGRLNSF